MRKFKIILLLSIVAFSCQNSFQKTNNKYKNTLKKFPNELSKYFPKELSDSFNFSESYNTKYSPVSFKAKFIYKKSEFENKIKSLNDFVLKEYKSNDPNLLIINPFYNLKNDFDIPWLNENNKRQQLFSKDYIPVPNFIDINRKTRNKCNLSDDYVIKVFEFEKGNKWKEFHNDSNWNLPIGYEDGASSGIAVNSKKRTIIYWLSIW